MNNAAALRHDAAALLRFIDSITNTLEQGEDYPPYIESSVRFFDYIRALGKCTKEFLRSFPARAPRNPRHHLAYRQKLYPIRFQWFELHELIKSSVEADTLHLPWPLIQSFTQLFRNIPGFANAAFTVFHIDELNYLQIGAVGIRELATDVRCLLPGAPTFPPDLGMIGMPYSQSSSLFLNCLLVHEMGHHLYAENAIRERFVKVLNATTFGKKLRKMSPLIRSWAVDTLASWAEEIFCDLFAVSLIGPSYSFAFAEVFDLIGAMGFGRSFRPEATDFNESHPADALRVQQQMVLLSEMKWWPKVRKFRTHYVELFQNAFAIRTEAFSFPVTGDVQGEKTHLAPSVLEAFFPLLKEIREMVRAVTGPSDGGLKDYLRYHARIEALLSWAVVPSSVRVGRARSCPPPTAILNSAFKFYLESMDNLMARIEGRDPVSVEHRADLMQRLELWAMKAMEDFHLLQKSESA